MLRSTGFVFFSGLLCMLLVGCGGGPQPGTPQYALRMEVADREYAAEHAFHEGDLDKATVLYEQLWREAAGPKMRSEGPYFFSQAEQMARLAEKNPPAAARFQGLAREWAAIVMAGGSTRNQRHSWYSLTREMKFFESAQTVAAYAKASDPELWSWLRDRDRRDELRWMVEQYGDQPLADELRPSGLRRALEKTGDVTVGIITYPAYVVIGSSMQ